MKSHGSIFRGLVSAVYIHFAGVIGALSIASLLSYVIEWRGFIHAAVDWWAGVVRPIVDLVFSPVVYLLDKYLLTDFYIPILVKDYLAVGIAFIFSRWRGAAAVWKGGTGGAARKIVKRFVMAPILLARTLFMWPVEMAAVFLNVFYARSRFPKHRGQEQIRQIRLTHALALLPVLYALFIVIANFFIEP